MFPSTRLGDPPVSNVIESPAELHFLRLSRLLRDTGLSQYFALKHAAIGDIRVKAIPGRMPEYCLEDALRVAAERAASA
jgi:hypothetical protein